MPWKGHIRMLMYPIQFDANPSDHVDSVLKIVVDKDKHSTPNEYLVSIVEALKSSEALAELLPQDHDEAVIRAFLGDVAKALRTRANPSP